MTMEAAKGTSASRDRFLEELPDQELADILRQLILKVKEYQAGFEESLLDQELWTSVDLLQNVGIQHHQMFGGLVDKSQEQDVDTEVFKALLREGRTAFSEWLFDRFKHISAQTGPTQGAQQAFEELFSSLEEICRSLQKSRITVTQHEELFAASPRDSLYVGWGKLAKRLRRRLGKKEFERRFSLRRLVCFHLLGQLPRKLLRIANMLGEAEFFLLRRVKGLSEEIDQANISFLTLLDQEETQNLDGARLAEKAAKLRDELDESFRLVGAEVMKYYDDVRAALEAEVSGCLDRLVADARLAGTIELPERRFQLKSGELERWRRRVTGQLELWGRYQVGFTGSYTMGLEMVRVQNRLRHAVDETVLQVNGRLRLQLEEILTGLSKWLEKTASVARTAMASEGSVDETRQQIEQERDKLLDYLGSEVQRRLRSIQASGEINQLMDLLMERFRRLADQTVESFQVVEEKDLPVREGQVPENVEIKIAPVRAVVRTYLERELIHRLGDINGAMIGQVREMEAGIDDLWQNVSFSLGNVVVELREAGKEPGELIPIALSRLQRAQEQLQGRYREIQESNRETGERVIREVADTARMLKQLVLEETVREMRREIGGRITGSRRWKLREEQRREPEPAVAGIGGKDKIPQPVSFQEEEAGQVEALDYEGILDLETELTARVPFAYRRLFRTTPLEVSEFLAGRSGALGIIQAACKRWRQGRFSSVIVIGEQGSGKTSLINCAMEQILKGLPLVRHRISITLLEEPGLVRLLNQLLDMKEEDLEDLREKIASSHGGRIIILEDLHRLYLRAVGGLDLLLRFLEFIDATGDRILWLVSIDQYAWQYLDHVQQISRHFAFRIETGQLSRQELEGAIMARHRATGYRLRFPDGQVRREGNQEILRQGFFDRLSRASGGNVFSAIFYWLRSVQGVEEDALVIAPLEELKLESLGTLPLGDLLNLAMLIQHGGLSVEKFSAIFRIPLAEGRARLTHLERLGILKHVEDAEGQNLYMVDQILYHPIAAELKRRNLFK